MRTTSATRAGPLADPARRSARPLGGLDRGAGGRNGQRAGASAAPDNGDTKYLALRYRNRSRWPRRRRRRQPQLGEMWGTARTRPFTAATLQPRQGGTSDIPACRDGARHAPWQYQVPCNLSTHRAGWSSAGRDVPACRDGAARASWLSVRSGVVELLLSFREEFPPEEFPPEEFPPEEFPLEELHPEEFPPEEFPPEVSHLAGIPVRIRGDLERPVDGAPFFFL